MRGRPIHVALAGMLAMLVVAALPAQIDWADRLGPPELAGDRLRFLTVSPTLLLNERSGWPAYLTELLWAALFLALLLVVCWRFATATADEWTRPVVLALALPVVAPLANLVALFVVNAGGLTTDAAGRGARLAQVFTDAQDAAGHAMLVALAGTILVIVTHADRLWPRGPDGSPSVTRETVLVVLRGPTTTLWRRIGLAVLTALVAYLAMTVVPDLLARGFDPVARLWCAGSSSSDGCVANLTHLAGEGPTDPSILLLDQGRARFLQLYAAQVFGLLFALAYFQVHTQPLRSRPVTTLLAVWYAYTLAVVAYEGVLDAGLGFADEPRLAGILGLLLPPSGLPYTLLAAPAVAVVFAAVHALVARLRKRTQPSQPGVTSPAS